MFELFSLRRDRVRVDILLRLGILIVLFVGKRLIVMRLIISLALARLTISARIIHIGFVDWFFIRLYTFIKCLSIHMIILISNS